MRRCLVIWVLEYTAIHGATTTRDAFYFIYLFIYPLDFMIVGMNEVVMLRRELKLLARKFCFYQ